MNRITVVVDVQNDVAAIPGNGNTPVTFTHTSDIGRFVAASLDLKRWDHVGYIAGDKVTWKQLVDLVQEVKGSTVNAHMTVWRN
ncbi:hypothetical protein S7711_04180 [Stachybotrys chartarum IBT 7711]|uniref:Uncharacterized protein n=1 Tax=Stachybotrys chartarum (strain CBS 109288 / IBT 7711) TaxID=1280523 RepID=A0A084B6N7_STACB|nr:hypothetical protein S7711_04180 [Stachybotrys chartarum IBT 7711]